MLPHGAFAPVPTPLNTRLEFDVEGLQDHLAWLASQGLDGALILGTNGEFPSLSLAERQGVAEAAAGADTSLQLMLGVGSCSLPEVLVMLEAATEFGYGSVLCPPPFYYRAAPVTGLAEFFREVLEKAKVPVLLYHIPQVTGVSISDELLDNLGTHGNFAGVKDSSGNEEELSRLCGRFGREVYMVGSDRLVTACRNAGGRGSISAAASVAPALVRAVQRGEVDQKQLDAIRGLLESFGLGPAVKAILHRCGFGDFATRPPLVGLDGPSEEDLWARFCDLVPTEQRPAVV